MNVKENAPVAKKRGRKPKAIKPDVSNETPNLSVCIDECISAPLPDVLTNSDVDTASPIDSLDFGGKMCNSVIDVLNEQYNAEDVKKDVPKKRGRKPKGGKIVNPSTNVNPSYVEKPNVILHLRCYLKELAQHFENVPQYMGYNEADMSKFSYQMLSPSCQNGANVQMKDPACHYEDCAYDNEAEYSADANTNPHLDKKEEIKEIWNKLKILERNLHLNNVNDKKSACFWCTCDFDNPAIYIPKFYLKDVYHVYGSFCTPECATAYLMDEKIDTSTKFERYHLLNHIYSSVYDYKKNINPAPNPYYMLDKFCGNLNIQEYRSLLRNDRLYVVVDKPLTRILPELHETNDDFIMNNKIIPSNNNQMRKKLKRNNKTNILSEKFGLHLASAE
jgi:hypothetical protein